MHSLTYEVICEIGKRLNNEDSFLVNETSGIFIVCDGVGGNTAGEVASKLCCESFDAFFTREKIVFPDLAQITKALLYTEQCFSHYTSRHPESSGMGTTLALLSVRQNKAIIAHIGDSRVYHIRNGEILYVTTDHSLVAELVASGYIKPEEARNHPRKNVIIRAVQGSGHPTEADIFTTENVLPGDYFLLCTDGVLESITDKYIKKKFKASSDTGTIITGIKEICLRNSNDNFTAVVVRSGPNHAAAKVNPIQHSLQSRPWAKKVRLPIFLFMMLSSASVLLYSAQRRYTNPRPNAGKANLGIIVKKELAAGAKIPAKARAAIE